MAFVVTAVAAAIEVTTVATVLTAISAVGLATSAVGLVTGNASLMKFGGELGLVGGLGGLAAGALGGVAAGAADVGADMTNMFADSVPGAAGDLASGASGIAGEATNLAGDAATTLPVSDPSSGMLNGATDATAMPVATGSPPPIDSSLPGSPSFSSPVSTQPSISTPDGLASTSLDGTGMPIDPNSSPTVYPGGSAPSVAGPGPGSGSLWESLKNGADSTSTWFKALKPEAQAEFIKSALAVPGGIQAQQNKAAELAMTQQRVNQSSYGSSVPTFGIIGRAQKGTS